MNDYQPYRMGGRSEKDRGRLYHAVPPLDPDPHVPAACGEKPGYSTKGWYPERGQSVTCVRCLTKLTEMYRCSGS